MDKPATLDDALEAVNRLTGEVRRARRASRWSKVRDALLALSVGFDIWLTIIALGASYTAKSAAGDAKHAITSVASTNDCRNTHSSRFFSAEIAKVQGQVAGFDQEIRAERIQLRALQDIISAETSRQGRRAFNLYVRGTRTAITGQQAVITASNAYLVTVARLEAGC